LLEIAAVVLAAALGLFFLRFWLLSQVAKLLFAIVTRFVGARHRRVNIDGVDWHFLDSGGVDKPVMVVLHGYGADKYNWLLYIRVLKGEFRLIAPDLPGFGQTYNGDLQADYGIADQVARLKGFVAALNLDRIHLAGNSMGGFIAARFALTYPQGVLSLTLMDAAGLTAARKTVLEESFEHNEILFLPRTRAQAETVLAMAVARQVKLPFIAIVYLLKQISERRPVLEKIFRQLMADHKSSDLSQKLAVLDMPVLVIWGRKDQLLDVSAAENLAPFLRKGELVILDNVGHAPMIEAVAETATHHREFIGRRCLMES
jgi:pimeloyl-ACP methyl ester carboxylesterase